MKKKTTPFLLEQSTDKKKSGKESRNPGQEVIKFLKLFARNYHIEPELPEGLQEIIMG